MRELLSNRLKSKHLREPYYNWNPPSCNILTIACDSDVDDSLELPDFSLQNNNVINSFDGENPLTDNDSLFASDASQIENNNTSICVVSGSDSTQNGILHSHFKNNWEIIAQKLTNFIYQVL